MQDSLWATSPHMGMIARQDPAGRSPLRYAAAMTTFALSAPWAIRAPSREELRAMLQDRAVAITVVICTTLTVLAAFASVVFLAATGNDTAVIGFLIGGPVVAVLSVLTRRLAAVQEAVRNGKGGKP